MDKLIKLFGTELYMSTTVEDKVTEEDAIVQTIQNLCFIKPGTYPNDPDLGLGIEDEQFEIADTFYLGELQSRLNAMIDKYIETDYYVETRVSLKKIDIITSQKCLIIEVFVGPNQIDLAKIDLLFTRIPATNKLKFNVLR